MRKVGSRVLNVGNSVVVTLISLSVNEISEAVDLSGGWLLGGCVVLVVSSLLLQAFVFPSTGQATIQTEAQSGDVHGVPGRKSKLNWRVEEAAFPLGITLGVGVGLLALHFDVRSNLIPILGLSSAHTYEISASVIGVLLCIGYRYFVGSRGLVSFGFGLGLGTGAAIVILDPMQNVVALTLMGHSAVLVAAAMTLKVTRKRWWYALSIPGLVLSAFLVAVSPYAFYWAMGRLQGPSDGSWQADNLEISSAGSHTQYYEVPFIGRPALKVELNGVHSDATKLRVTEQDSLGFSIEIEGDEFPVSVWFEARGTPVKR